MSARLVPHAGSRLNTPPAQRLSVAQAAADLSGSVLSGSRVAQGSTVRPAMRVRTLAAPAGLKPACARGQRQGGRECGRSGAAPIDQPPTASLCLPSSVEAPVPHRVARFAPLVDAVVKAISPPWVTLPT
jgi:hypothetical protein